MAREVSLMRRCFLALPRSPEFAPVKRAVDKATREAGFRLIVPEEGPGATGRATELVFGELARADCLIADVTDGDARVIFEVGLAYAMGKALFLLARDGLPPSVPLGLNEARVLMYEGGQEQLLQLTQALKSSLAEFRRSPRRARLLPGAKFSAPFFVDWERLDRVEAENLCRELLAQMGFQQVDWAKESHDLDLVAELPRKDPDGFEYRELWLISMGRHVPPEMLLEMALMDTDFFIHRVVRSQDRLERIASRPGVSASATVLIILLEEDHSRDLSERMATMAQQRSPKAFPRSSLRVRIWDRTYLTSLVQQFPQIGYKYFSDEGRAQSKFRKTPEELYGENIKLTLRQAKLISDLEEEKNRRVRAERDAVWKDISFSAAHKIGNPIFAIETDLDPLERRVHTGRTEDALEVIGNMRSSIEKAKAIVDQFKSLTRAQQITPQPIALSPILEEVCRTAIAQGVFCEVTCPAGIVVVGDAERLAECFDELLANATHWFDKPEKRIVIEAGPPGVPLPSVLDSSGQYALVHFKDNGRGVPVENKTKIFDAFFTTHDHGTGLGLALVRRVIEGHGGVVLESGVPNQGADFELYLPLARGMEDAATASGAQV